MPGRLEPEPLPRRDFLSIAGMWSAGVAIVGSIAGMARLPKPRVLPEASSRFRVGKPDDYQRDEVRNIEGRHVRIVNTPKGFAAMSLVCTHLGCIVKESETGFDCPCHGSKFNAAGKAIAGPAPRALVWLSLSRAADGSLMVDTNQEVAAGEYFEA